MDVSLGQDLLPKRKAGDSGAAVLAEMSGPRAENQNIPSKSTAGKSNFQSLKQAPQSQQSEVQMLKDQLSAKETEVQMLKAQLKKAERNTAKIFKMLLDCHTSVKASSGMLRQMLYNCQEAISQKVSRLGLKEPKEVDRPRLSELMNFEDMNLSIESDDPTVLRNQLLRIEMFSVVLGMGEERWERLTEIAKLLRQQSYRPKKTSSKGNIPMTEDMKQALDEETMSIDDIEGSMAWLALMQEDDPEEGGDGTQWLTKMLRGLSKELGVPRWDRTSAPSNA